MQRVPARVSALAAVHSSSDGKAQNNACPCLRTNGGKKGRYAHTCECTHNLVAGLDMAPHNGEGQHVCRVVVGSSPRRDRTGSNKRVPVGDDSRGAGGARRVGSIWEGD